MIIPIYIPTTLFLQKKKKKKENHSKADACCAKPKEFWRISEDSVVLSITVGFLLEEKLVRRMGMPECKKNVQVFHPQHL